MNMIEKRTPLLLLMRLMFVWHLERYEYDREENFTHANMDFSHF